MSAILITPATTMPIRVSACAGEPLAITPVPTGPITIVGNPAIPGPVGPAGPAGESYEHQQPSASESWVIPHNLKRRPSVSAHSTGGMLMEGHIVHLSTDVVVISFLIPVAGSAHLV